jgi:hypothetical protein
MDAATNLAKALFNYRQEAVGRCLPCDPDWEKVVREAINSALNGERGETDQQQCVYQAIRLTEWESGAISLPWTKAFLPKPILPVVFIPWYLRYWRKLVDLSQRVWGRISELL